MVCRTDTNPTSTRVCIKCSGEKPFTAFAVDRSKRDGRRNMCAECRADYDCERSYRSRCGEHGHVPVVEPFTRRQIVERYGDRCYYCQKGAFETVDHVLCVRVGGHHTLDNAVPCCFRCNRQKRWDIDELLIRRFYNTAQIEVSS